MTLRSFVSLTAGRALGKFARTSSWGLTSWPIDNASLECSHERCHGSYGIRRISFQAFLAFCSLGAEDRVLLWFVRHECKREKRWGGGYHWLWSRIVLRGKAGIYLFVDRHRRPIQVRQTGKAGFSHFGCICVNARTAYIESQINSCTKKISMNSCERKSPTPDMPRRNTRDVCAYVYQYLCISVRACARTCLYVQHIAISTWCLPMSTPPYIPQITLSREMYRLGFGTTFTVEEMSRT